MTDLIDSYSESNKDLNLSISKVHPSNNTYYSSIGQSFTMVSANHKITSAKFYLVRMGTLTGFVLNAVLYAHSGVFGTSSVPTGAALATSDNYDAQSIGSGSYSLITFVFSGANQYTMLANTYYVIQLQATSGAWDPTHYINIGMDNSSPTHPGNGSSYKSPGWFTTPRDICFYVYGDAVAAPAAGGILVQVMLVRIPFWLPRRFLRVFFVVARFLGLVSRKIVFNCFFS
jgi:hypothetical protein